ncbi:MAG: AMP-binding protein [Clostridiaceae bacterium]|nr:AMP-binding protein [Clostridiaceae bacterium]
MKRRIIANLSKEMVFCLERERGWTYPELREQVCRFAAYFTLNKVGRVCIQLEQGFYAYAAITAAYLSGTVFCVIDKNQPIERKQYITGAFLPDLYIVLTNADKFADNSMSIEEFGYWNGSVESLVRDNKHIYVLFTSGSTGRPKGVLVKSSAIERLVSWAIPEFDLCGDDIYGQYAPLFFDMSMLDVFAAVSVGCSIVPFSSMADKLRPANLIEKFGITFWNSVPQVLEVLENSGGFKSEKLKSLRTIKFGGDKIYQLQIEKLFTLLPDCNVVLTYGPTEITVFCTYAKMNRADYKSFSKGIMTMGKAVPGWDVRLKDEESGVGEIVVCGAYIGDGYIDGASGAFFKRTGETEYTEYSTGDFAEEIDGYYYFHGRRDNQVKLNGIRVDLSEIENALIGVGCKRFEVIAQNDLIYLAYVDVQADEKFIRGTLIKKLPKYLVPSVVKRFDSFPLTPNGKTDRQALIKELSK